MNDEFDLNGTEDSFWGDVDLDSIRAMLDEDMGQEPVQQDEWQQPDFESALDSQCGPAPQRPADSGWNEPLPHERQWNEPQPFYPKREDPRGRRPYEAPAPANRKSSKGAVITLSVIILLELAGIIGVLVSWYLWMH